MSQIAILGTGLMGFPLAERLLESGAQVAVYNRTCSKTESLAKQGATPCTTPADAIAAAQCSLLLLSDERAIRETLFESTPQPRLAGKTIIQMGTISPAQSRALAGTIEERGGTYLEAPVLGGPAQARTGKLIVMVGATAEQYRQHHSLLQNLGSEPIHVGPVGAAAALKLALNQLIAAHMAAFSLSYGFIEQSGVAPEIFLSVLRQSALHAPMFDNKLPKLQARDFTRPNFPVKHLLKDVELFLSAASETRVNPIALEAVREILLRAMQKNLAEMDYSALSEIVRDAGAL